MLGVLCALACSACIPQGAPIPRGPGSYLCQPAYVLDDKLRGPSTPYEPQEGDVLLFSDHSLMWNTLFALGMTGPPHHVGLIVRRPDGSLATMEAGYDDSLYCRVADLPHRLHTYEGQLYVRRRRIPLTAEQSAKLTAFAMAQDGKPYALVRLLGQLTPLRSRGPLRTYLLGGPQGKRSSYLCTELVLDGLVAAGLLDPKTTRSGAIYPRDMFFDSSLNPYVNAHCKLSRGWYPPARWSSFPKPGPSAVAVSRSGG